MHCHHEIVGRSRRSRISNLKGLALVLATSLCVTSLASEVEAGAIALVTSAGSSTVEFIDVDSATVIGSVALEDQASLPTAIAVTPDGSTAVVVGPTGYVSFIDVSQMQYLGTLPLLAGPEMNSGTPQPNEFSGVAITPDGVTALVTEGNEFGELFFIDIASMTEEPRHILPIGDDPDDIVTRMGGRAYAHEANLLFDINLSAVPPDFPPPCTMDVPDEIDGFALTPDESRAVLSGLDNVIYLVDVSTCERLASLPIEEGFTEPTDVAIFPDGATAIVANTTDQTVTFLTVGPMELTNDTTIAVSGTPNAMAFLPENDESFEGQGAPRSIRLVTPWLLLARATT